MPVLDASVCAALVHERDRFHEPATRWLKGALDENRALLAPTLLLAEVAGALTRVSSRDLGLRSAQVLASIAQLGLEPLSHDRGIRAAEIAADCGLRGPDAVYLALAEETGEPLITFDREQAERGAGVAEIEWPGDAH